MEKEYKIYTDGACIGNGKAKNIGGWGFAFITKDELFFKATGTEKNTTNNRQEIRGVLNALYCCIEYKMFDFSIYSDSQYVVNGINNWMHSWFRKGFKRGFPPADIPNADLWKEVYSTVSMFDRVDIFWVRGHSGNKWNEFIDIEIQKEINKILK